MAYSAFENDYKNAVNNILKEIYGETEYWGTGPAGNQGIVKPLNDDDDSDWSNYNFINTHWIVRDSIITPFLGNLPIDKNLKYSVSDNNTNFFRALYKRKDEIFGPDSPLKGRIIKAINGTRKSGTKREGFVKIALESIEGVTVNMIAEAGGTEDFKGIDITIESTNNVLPSGSGQVKPFKGIKTDKNYWYVDADVRRAYTTDYMIFGKQEGMKYHVAVFKNEPKTFHFLDNGLIAIPKNLIKLLLNYNLISKKSEFKSY